MRFTLQIITHVPIFADVTIEAASEAEAYAKGEQLLADGGAPMTVLIWTHGEAVSTPIPFALDERDLDAAEIQGVIPATEA